MKILFKILFALIVLWHNLFPQGVKSIHQIESEKYSNIIFEKSKYDESGAGIIPLDVTKKPALTKRVFGFLPYWQYSSYKNYIKYNLITHLACFSFGVSSTGSMSNPSNWPWTDVIDSCHSNGVKVILTVTNFDGTSINKILTDTTVKNTFFTNLKNKIQQYSFDGVSIDFEGVNTSDRGSRLNSFMSSLTNYLKSFFPTTEVSFCGPAVNWGGWDLPGLAAACDYIFIMGYDFYGSWSTSTGPSAPLTGGSYNLTNTVNTQYAGISGNKLILGLPLYGNYWLTATNASHSSVILYKNHPFYETAEGASQLYGKQWASDNQDTWYRWQDTIWNQVWIDGDSSLQLKFNLAKNKNYSGVGFWALTYDGARTEIWNLIRDNFGTANNNFFTKAWVRTANGAGTSSFPSWFSTSGNSERGLAYGVINGNERLLVASRNLVNSIRILNANTGADVDTLPLAGVSGGTYPINDVEISDDGKIFVCNLTTSASTSAFKIYMWNSETSAPVNIINYNARSYRLGDKFTVKGAYADSTVAIYAAAANSNKVLVWKISNGSFASSPLEITLSNTTNVGITPQAAPKDTGLSQFYLNANSITPAEYNYDGTLAGTIPSSVVGNLSNAIRYISLGTKKYIITYLAGPGNESARMVDVSQGAGATTTGDILGTTQVLGTNTNTNTTGDIHYKMNSDGTITIYLLSTNNGIGAFRSNTVIPFSLETNLNLFLSGYFLPATTKLLTQDTINVYLRNSVSPYALADSAKIVLNENGNAYAKFLIAGKGNYYIVIKHRNHLETWSSQPVSFQNYSTSYDFSKQAEKAFGSNQILLGSKYCIYSGDVNNDGKINSQDLTLIQSACLNFSRGYLTEDLTGDGVVDINDVILVDRNYKTGVSVKRP